ncbi:MAG: hypothetical protein R3B67_13690 [Phycisphaerales bacterium]
MELKDQKAAISVGWHGNAIALLERLIARNITPDTLTDQTSTTRCRATAPSEAHQQKKAAGHESPTRRLPTRLARLDAP